MRKITRNICVVAALAFGMTLNAQVQTAQSQVNASSDDAEERGANATSGTGTIDLTSSDIELTNDGGDGDQYIGLRFNNLNIPQGAFISNAYIQFTVDETDNSPGTVVFQVEAVDNSTTFTSTAFDISSRTVVNDSVLWSNIPAWTNAGDAGADQQSPDLARLVQHIVNRGGWASGNSLNFIIHGTGERTAEAYDGTSASAATLIVEYSTPVNATFSIAANNDDAEMDASSGAMDLSSSDIELTADGSSNQLVGMRFQNVNIPAGSIIQNAYIQFTVDEVNTTGQVDVMIALEDTDNAAPITGTAGNLSGRSYTDSTLWNSIPAWSTIGDAGADQRSANFSAQLQHVIDRAGWAAGNAVLVGMIDPALLGVSGYTGNTGKRVAQTRDKSTADAPKLVVSYIAPAVYQNGTFPIAKASSWKYNDNGTDLSASNWTALTYNDSSWAYGDAILGYDNGNETTTLDFGGNSAAKHITYYLRNTFEVTNAAQYDSLVFDVLRDDGVVVYVNGTEAFRMNMPAGPVTAATLASSAVGGGDETTYFRAKTANLLVNGTNVIAVELHQAAASSSDLSFDMEVGFELPPLAAAAYPFPKESDWHYLDNGSDMGASNWTALSFNDDNWAQGQGPLGYGDPMKTEISFGPDPANKFITTYFRRSIDINMSTMPDSVIVGMRRDDGAILYVNGVEVLRENMPAGTVNYRTKSATIVSGGDEQTYFTTILSKNIFTNGINQLAVELHNRDSISSDLGFDMYIQDAPRVNPPASGCVPGQNHIACYTSIAPTSQTNNMLFPTATHRFQLIFKQGEAYTDGSGNVPGNHDFTGFVGLNGSSTVGHLSVNHENNPGGVSMLNLHYEDSTKLWIVDSTKKVDFYNNDLITTVRNCSGGITPWGTVITAEESLNNADANNDGYTDVGWLVEIDPITAKVVEYGNGKQEKIWGAGRISHENAVVLNDSVTLYTGEDGGSSAVYKFVADNKADLSSGTLYALKLDNPMVGYEPTGTTGTWVQIPNSTPTEANNTQSAAIALGATNFNGVEDVEVGTIDGKMYFTAKGANRVYRFTDNGTTVSNFETFVGGASYVLNTDQGVFTEPWGGGNDNLTFDDQGNLWVLQDGGNNYVWMVRPNHTQASPAVELFMSAPLGSEPTGMTFSPDYRFGFISIQHPSGSNAPQMDASGNMVNFDASATMVFARKEYLGAQTPIAGFEADTQKVVLGGAITFTDTSANYPTSRMWIFNGGVPAVSSNKVETVTYNGAGVYAVELRVSNSAGADTAVYTQYVEVIDNVSLKEDWLHNNLSVYPNPTKDVLNLSLNLEAGGHVVVEAYDLTGRKVANLLDTPANGGENTWKFDLARLSNQQQALVLKISVDGKVAQRMVQLIK
jgi:hypothetical protein